MQTAFLLMFSRQKAKRWAREELAHVTNNGGYYSVYWLREKTYCRGTESAYQYSLTFVIRSVL